MMPCSHDSTLSAFDPRVRIGTLELKNPVLTASGTFGTGKEYSELLDIEALGAIVTKGVSLAPWEGNPGIRVFETPGGMLNSIGLQNPGVEAFCTHDLAWLRQHFAQTTVIVNVSGHNADEYVRVIDRLEQEPDICAYEINISCPNVDHGGLAFGVSAQDASQIAARCRKATRRPIIMKLTPNVTDIGEIGRACEDAGADAVSLINTVLGCAIDIRARKFIFSRKIAGLSGPAIKPIALRMVYEVARAVDIPIIGMGGIANAEDALEFILAGASAVAIGTGTFLDPTTVLQCIQGIADYGQEQGFSTMSDLIGALKE